MSIESDKAFYIAMGALDRETQRQAARERDLEEYCGELFPRCPICLGRRKNYAIGKVCAYCGHKEGQDE